MTPQARGHEEEKTTGHERAAEVHEAAAEKKEEKEEQRDPVEVAREAQVKEEKDRIDAADNDLDKAMAEAELERIEYHHSVQEDIAKAEEEAAEEAGLTPTVTSQPVFARGPAPGQEPGAHIPAG